MKKSSIWRSVASLALAVLVVSLGSVCSRAQQTLGSINGTVFDSSGAAVAGAQVTVTDESINVVRSATSQGDGFFQIFNLPIGVYKIKATHDGFDTTQLTAVAVQEARATTVQISLKVGQVSTSVEVTATPLLNATDTTNGYTLDNAQIAAVPTATGSFTQLAILSPGTNAELLSGLNTNSGLGNQNIQANGQRATSNTMQVNGVDVTNIFNGMTSSGLTSQRFNFNIGAGSTSASSSAGAGPIAGSSLEGASPYGSVGNSLPSPAPETIEELRVNTSMYDAQQGATAGAQIDVNTVSGTNRYHGQVYGTLANNDMNASPYFFNQQYQLAQQGVGAFPASLVNPYLNRWAAGGTIGGPIKKDKLFFFLSYQRMSSTDQATGISQMTVPSGLTDDRSVAGLDAAANSWAGKGSFTSAIDPLSMALMNAKLPDGSYLIPSAQSSNPYTFGVPNVTLIGNAIMTSDQANGNVDWQLNSKDRLSAKYYYQSDPVTLPYDYSQTGGFPVTQLNGSQVAAIDNTININSHFSWEQRLGLFRQSAYSKFDQTLTNSGGAENFGVGAGTTTANGAVLASTLPGLRLKSFASSQADSPSVKVGPYSSFADMGFYQSRLNPSTNLILVLGKHTIMAGGGYSFTELNIENNRGGLAQIQTGNFEQFLQGNTLAKPKAVSSSNVLETLDPATGKNNADRYYRTNEIDGYAQDKWQVRPNLSITAGVRYDYHGGMTEKYGNMFNFEPSLYSVTSSTGGADYNATWTVNNAGFIVAGNNKQNPTSGVSDSTLTGRQWGISPRVGFAWSPARDHGDFVVRGGAGIYYDRGEYFTYLSQPAGSGYGGPFGVTESAPLATYVTGGGKTLENPFGSAFTSSSYVKPSSDPTGINTALQSVLNGMGADDFGTANCSGYDSEADYTACEEFGTPLNFGTYDRTNVLPYTINFDLDIQWQPSSTVAFDLGYVGNRGRHAVVPIPFNAPGIATANSPIWGQTTSYGFDVLNQNNTDSYGDYYPIAGEYWNTLDGGNTDLRTPFIGFSPNASYYKTAGVSSYDALQAHIDKKMSHHLMLGASYTWSHTLDEQSDLGLFFTGDNPNNLRNSWASSDFDRTNVFSGYFVATLPNKATPHSGLAMLINDWQLNGTAVVQSGEPYSLYEFYGAVGSIYFGDFPTLMNPILGVKNPGNPKEAMTGNKGASRGVGGAYVPTIDPTQIAINYITGDKAVALGIPQGGGPNNDPPDVFETDFAPPQRNIFRQDSQKQVNLSIRKAFKFSERFGAEYQFNVFNVTNTTSLDVPSDQAQIRQNNACSSSAIEAGNNCFNPAADYVNYGQIATSPKPADLESTRANLDQPPYSTGAGKGLQIPTYIPTGTTNAAGAQLCLAENAIPGGCPNNAANFGSVYNTIGSNRMITMGFHFTY